MPLALLLLLLPSLLAAKSGGGGDGEEVIDFQVTEGAKIGSRVGSLASNVPSGLGGRRLGFSFTQPSRYFALDRRRGELTVKSVIDREALCNGHATCCPQDEAGVGASAEGGSVAEGACYLPAVVLLAVDGDPRRVFSVRVHVVDVNDEPPRFPAPQQRVVLAEDAPVGTQVSLQAARDGDHPRHATRTYRLEHCDAPIFNLTYSRTPGRRKGFDVRLVLTRALDREAQARYRCRVAASDGVHTESMDVEVWVEDVNDNGPRWTSTVFQVSIPEDTQRYKEILRLRATDKDEKFGHVRYRFAGGDFPGKGQHPFAINADSGVITVERDLDFDVKGGKLYHLPIVAYDNGSPVPLSATATLTVAVTDVNDNAPVIQVAKNPLRIRENELPAHLTLITVRDKDQGANGRVACSLPDALSDFELRRIATGTYSLRMKAALDREALPQKGYVKTRVECRDLGEPPNVSEQRVLLYVDDLNDNAPRFAKRVFEVHFEEGNEQGVEILVARAEDKDRGQNAKLDFALVDPDRHRYVAVHRHSGAITAAEAFDREVRDRYEFQVLVQDFGRPRLNDTARVVLHITDRNDNAPKFEGGAAFRVPENATEGTLLARLNATDPDKGENGSVRFQLVYPYYENAFRVSPNGEIRLVGQLDREKTAHYSATVKAEDGGVPAQSSTTTLLFEILDVNDSPPRFQDFVHYVNLSCADALEHSVVAKLEAEDADSLPENRQFRFRLEEYPRVYPRPPLRAAPAATAPAPAPRAPRPASDRHRFAMDPASGRVTLAHAPKVCKPRNYRLFVTVFDPTRPQFEDSQRLIVHVQGQPRPVRPELAGGGRRYGGGGVDDGPGYPEDNDGMDNTILFVIILICVSIIILVLMVAVVLFLRRRPDDAEPEPEKDEPLRYPSQPSTCHLGRKEMQPLSEASGAVSVDDIYKHGDAELHEKAAGKLDGGGKSHYKTMPANFKEHFNECEDDDEDKTHKALLDQQASYESQHTYQSMASQDRSSQHEYTDFNQELFSYIPDSNLNKNKKKSPHFTISFV